MKILTMDNIMPGNRRGTAVPKFIVISVTGDELLYRFDLGFYSCTSCRQNKCQGMFF